MEIILTLDANEEWGKTTGKGPIAIEKMSVELGLYNFEKDQVINLPPTFPQSKRTLDHILVTNRVRECVEAMACRLHRISSRHWVTTEGLIWTSISNDYCELGM